METYICKDVCGIVREFLMPSKKELKGTMDRVILVLGRRSYYFQVHVLQELKHFTYRIKNLSAHPREALRDMRLAKENLHQSHLELYQHSRDYYKLLMGMEPRPCYYRLFLKKH